MWSLFLGTLCWEQAGSLRQGRGNKGTSVVLCTKSVFSDTPWVLGSALLPGRARHSDFSRFCRDGCLQGTSDMPGVSLCAPRDCCLWNMGGSVTLGTALLSDPCFAIWLLRIGVIMESFLREICCSVHLEFWLGVGSNAGLNSRLKILNTLRLCFDSFPKVIPQVPWLRYRKLPEQVICFKPWNW